MNPKSCITPQGVFACAVHKPSYEVDNLRQGEHLLTLGTLPDGTPVDNRANFPQSNVRVDQARVIYEIPNAFPFRGVTYIDSSWASSRAGDPRSIRIPEPPETSLSQKLDRWAAREGVTEAAMDRLFAGLPRAVHLAMATTSTDSRDLVRLARLSCDFHYHGDSCTPSGLWFTRDQSGNVRPNIQDHELFEAVANNPHLPDVYKEVMVLRPGIQGGNEIVGEWLDRDGQGRIFEYLRGNSYIPWGHYAANFAHDTVRYTVADVGLSEMFGLRRLYYRRVLVRLARELDIDVPPLPHTDKSLEELRKRVYEKCSRAPETMRFTASLWGWNFGFDYAPTGYRLHASHQQIHQQNALIPDTAPAWRGAGTTEDRIPAFSCGDLVADVVRQYRREHGQSLFNDYTRCLAANVRLDGRKAPLDLVVHEDDEVILFVPKAQTSQWELNLMPKGDVGNVLEAHTECRRALDRAMLLALQSLEALGARMVTCIEYSKRFTRGSRDQRLMYAFLPRLPWSPGAFSEAQLRFISGHYPEDFAAACRDALGGSSAADRT